MTPDIPAHVAVIMDGNGRWAKKRLLPRSVGHKKGVDAVRKVVRESARLGVRFLTLYAFSTENWKRPPLEVDSLMSLFLETIDGEIDELMANSISLRFIGLRTRLSEEMKAKIIRAESMTSGGDVMRVNVALDYSSRSELTDAFRRMALDGVRHEDIDEELIGSYLFTADCPDPDLMIRTGGEHRLSNFLLWQSAYCEFFFTDVLWPDFDETRLNEAFAVYARRERRYGGLT